MLKNYSIKHVLDFVGKIMATEMLRGNGGESLAEFKSQAEHLFEVMREEHDIAKHLSRHQDTLPVYMTLRGNSKELFERLEKWVESNLK